MCIKFRNQEQRALEADSLGWTPAPSLTSCKTLSLCLSFLISKVGIRVSTSKCGCENFFLMLISVKCLVHRKHLVTIFCDLMVVVLILDFIL